jgi:phenylalanyl-tRNA synthetase alpha chain
MSSHRTPDASWLQKGKFEGDQITVTCRNEPNNGYQCRHPKHGGSSSDVLRAPVPSQPVRAGGTVSHFPLSVVMACGAPCFGTARRRPRRSLCLLVLCSLMLRLQALQSIVGHGRAVRPAALATRWFSQTQAQETATRHPRCNVPENVEAKLGANLHCRPGHPLCTIKNKIAEYFQTECKGTLLGSPSFAILDDMNPRVPIVDNFDSLLIPEDHVSRSPSDTYYVDDELVLRTHTSAHQVGTLKKGESAFLLCGDVYRRDEIDRSHYPVFHQVEGVRVFSDSELDPSLPREERVAIVEADLKKALEGMTRMLFGDVEMRWVEEYFPFTEPSSELEIKFNGDWMEVLGCGVMRQGVLANADMEDKMGWAFGLGLERLAMVLFGIPDIRLFWSEDRRFISQFEDGGIRKFQSYSKYPPCLKDVSFWLPSAGFEVNDMNEIVRDVAGDLVEELTLVDEFVHPKTQRHSKCFRITYRSMDRSLTNEEIDALQETVRERLATRMNVELR